MRVALTVVIRCHVLIRTIIKAIRSSHPSNVYCFAYHAFEAFAEVVFRPIELRKIFFLCS